MTGKNCPNEMNVIFPFIIWPCLKRTGNKQSQELDLPACRRLLFPLLHAEKGRLHNAVANCVPGSRWVPKILGTCCDRLTDSEHCFGLIMYAVIYVIGVFLPKQIKTCAIVCRPFEILCEAAENLTCTRKLFLYNLLCMTHHIIFVNSV